MHRKSIFFHLVIAPLFFVATFIWVGFFATIHVEPHHDGVLFKPAMDVANGNILFKETFTQYGALTTFIQAFFLREFGETVFVMKLSAALFYALTAFVL